MPDLREMLRKAREEEVQRGERKITKGIRPDRILRGEIQFGDNGRVITLPGSLFPSSSGVESSTESNPVTNNPEQSQNKLPSQPRTNPEQTQNKVGTKSERLSRTKIKSQNKVSTQPRTQPRTKLEQSQNKPGTEPNFLSLVGLQRRIILFVYDLCRAKGERTTGSVSLEQLSNACRTTPGAAQVTIRRLIQKYLLRRANYKDGRGGWTDYELPEEVYGAVFQLESQNKLGTNTEQSQNKPPSQPRTQPRTSASSSSSYKVLDLKTTTTGPEENGAPASVWLDPAWQEIELYPLTEIKFSQNQVLQIANQGLLTPEQLQNSIYAFAFDLNENGKRKELKSAPLNYFMGILRKGPYAPAANYETPATRQMRRYLEAMKEQQKKHQEIESSLQAIEFEGWAAKLSLNEKSSMVPPTDFAKHGSHGHTVQLKEYFRENVWPQFREKILLETKQVQNIEST